MQLVSERGKSLGVADPKCNTSGVLQILECCTPLGLETHSPPATFYNLEDPITLQAVRRVVS